MKRLDKAKGFIVCKNPECGAVLAETRIVEPGPAFMLASPLQLNGNGTSDEDYTVCKSCGWRTYFRTVTYDEGRLTRLEAYRADPPD